MIEVATATVYRAPTKGRRYLSKRAAIHAEARALIEKKYPTEKFEEDTGHHFHWSELPRSKVMYRRMVRLVAASLPTTQPTKEPTA